MSSDAKFCRDCKNFIEHYCEYGNSTRCILDEYLESTPHRLVVRRPDRTKEKNKYNDCKDFVKSGKWVRFKQWIARS